MTRNFITWGLSALAYDDLLLGLILSSHLFAAAERQRENARIGLQNLYGTIFPIHLTVWIIGITYSCISPILMPFVAMYFSFGFIVTKYQSLYMNVPKYETGYVSLRYTVNIENFNMWKS